METRGSTVLVKYTENDFLIIFGLNPDINDIIIKMQLHIFHLIAFQTSFSNLASTNSKLDSQFACVTLFSISTNFFDTSSTAFATDTLSMPLRSSITCDSSLVYCRVTSSTGRYRRLP